MTYIYSQIFVVLCYLFYGLSYLIKNRYTILCMSILAIICNGISYVFLNAWAGFGAVIIAFIRNIILIIQERFEGDKDYTKMDWIVLIFLLSATCIFAYITFNGWICLFATLSTILYTISVWQHNLSVYNILGLFASICGIIYYIYIWSIFGFILESILFVFLLINTISYFIKQKTIIREDLNG